jgi:Retrotransposon gag protein
MSSAGTPQANTPQPPGDVDPSVDPSVEGSGTSSLNRRIFFQTTHGEQFANVIIDEITTALRSEFRSNNSSLENGLRTINESIVALQATMERLFDPHRHQRIRERSPVASDASFATARNRERMATSPPVNPPVIPLVNLPPVRAQTQDQFQADAPEDPRDRQPPRRASHDDHDYDDQERQRNAAFSYSPIYAPRVLEGMTPAPQTQQRMTPHVDNLRSHVSPIRDFEPLQAPVDGARLPAMKAPKFGGRDREDVADWLNRMETHFSLYRIPERIQAPYAAERLKREARTYYIDCMKRNGGNALNWNQFRTALVNKFYNPRGQGYLLRQKLDEITYDGPTHAAEFCEKFRHYEHQIHDMTVPDKMDRLLKKLPRDADSWIRGQLIFHENFEMEDVYRLVRQWCITTRATSANRPSAPKLVRFGKRRDSKQKSASSATKPPSDSEEELDAIVNPPLRTAPLHLKQSDMLQVECYRCHRRGHFAKDCRWASPPSRASPKFVSKRKYPTTGRKPLRRQKMFLAEDDADDAGEEFDARAYSPSRTSHASHASESSSESSDSNNDSSDDSLNY